MTQPLRPERVTQDRVVQRFTTPVAAGGLGYRKLGDWHHHVGPPNQRMPLQGSPVRMGPAGDRRRCSTQEHSRRQRFLHAVGHSETDRFDGRRFVPETCDEQARYTTFDRAQLAKEGQTGHVAQLGVDDGQAQFMGARNLDCLPTELGAKHFVISTEGQADGFQRDEISVRDQYGARHPPAFHEEGVRSIPHVPGSGLGAFTVLAIDFIFRAEIAVHGRGCVRNPQLRR